MQDCMSADGVAIALAGPQLSPQDKREVAEDSQQLNLRDVGANSDLIANGQIFRSSQFHDSEMRSMLKIVAVLDLRETGHECRKASARVAELRPSVMASRLSNMHRTIMIRATRCPNCEGKLCHDDPNNLSPKVGLFFFF